MAPVPTRQRVGTGGASVHRLCGASAPLNVPVRRCVSAPCAVRALRSPADVQHAVSADCCARRSSLSTPRFSVLRARLGVPLTEERLSPPHRVRQRGAPAAVHPRAQDGSPLKISGRGRDDEAGCLGGRAHSLRFSLKPRPLTVRERERGEDATPRRGVCGADRRRQLFVGVTMNRGREYSDTGFRAHATARRRRSSRRTIAWSAPGMTPRADGCCLAELVSQWEREKGQWGRACMIEPAGHTRGGRWEVVNLTDVVTDPDRRGHLHGADRRTPRAAAPGRSTPG